MIKLLLAVALTASAADAYKVLTPVGEGGKPNDYRMIRYDLPPNTAARIQVSLTEKGDCYDTSGITWTKGEAPPRKVHSVNFDAWAAPVNGKKPAGCPRRDIKNKDGIRGGLHTVDIPAEKGGVHLVITYREGTMVRLALNPGP